MGSMVENKQDETANGKPLSAKEEELAEAKKRGSKTGITLPPPPANTIGGRGRISREKRQSYDHIRRLLAEGGAMARLL